MTWDDALDALAGALAEQQRAVAEGRVPAFSPPPSVADLGPVPAHLADRVRTLLAEADAVTAALTAATQAAAEQLRSVRAPRSGGSSFLDARV